MYRSTDNGENWTTSIEPENIKYDEYFEYNAADIQTILITSSGEIYVGTGILSNKGVLYSKDNGNTWTMKSNGLSSRDSRNILSLFMGHDGTLYASTLAGIYHSTDGGDNWLLQHSGPNIDLGKNGGGVAQVKEFVASTDGSIFATACQAGVIKSTDKGVTWNQFNAGLNIFTEH